jgi:hypothetical protein
VVADHHRSHADRVDRNDCPATTTATGLR